jgi:hypothetical protein
MGTRTSFRPRPVDVNKPLPIVRDLSELDIQEGGNGEKLPELKVGRPCDRAARPACAARRRSMARDLLRSTCTRQRIALAAGPATHAAHGDSLWQPNEGRGHRSSGACHAPVQGRPAPRRRRDPAAPGPRHRAASRRPSRRSRRSPIRRSPRRRYILWRPTTAITCRSSCPIHTTHMGKVSGPRPATPGGRGSL